MPYWRLYYHVVWTTRDRRPLLTPEIESDIHRLLVAVGQDLGAKVFIVNGIADHIHLVAAIPPKIAVSEWVRRLKGSTSRTAGHLPAADELYWQPGYGVVSFGKTNLATVVQYVERQKEHHRVNTLIPFLETEVDVSDGPD